MLFIGPLPMGINSSLIGIIYSLIGIMFYLKGKFNLFLLSPNNFAKVFLTWLFLMFLIDPLLIGIISSLIGIISSLIGMIYPLIIFIGLFPKGKDYLPKGMVFSPIGIIVILISTGGFLYFPIKFLKFLRLKNLLGPILYLMAWFLLSPNNP